MEFKEGAGITVAGFTTAVSGGGRLIRYTIVITPATTARVSRLTRPIKIGISGWVAGNATIGSGLTKVGCAGDGTSGSGFSKGRVGGSGGGNGGGGGVGGVRAAGTIGGTTAAVAKPCDANVAGKSISGIVLPLASGSGAAHSTVNLFPQAEHQTLCPTSLSSSDCLRPHADTWL